MNTGASRNGARVVIVICDSLRADLISPDDTPFLVGAGAARRQFRGAPQRLPLDDAGQRRLDRDRLLPGPPWAARQHDGARRWRWARLPFRRPPGFSRPAAPCLRPHPAVPTLAERLRWHGETSISCANVSPGAAYFQDPDGHGWVYHAAGSYGPGRRPLDDPASAALTKGMAGDRAMTERFCREIIEEREPALAIMWLSEPDYTGHHSPLGSPQHRAAIRGVDALVRQVFGTVRRLDPSGENILFMTGSDHGMETVAAAIDLDAILIEAGFKQGPGSSDVVIAPNGTAATLYFSDPASAQVERIAAFLATQSSVAGVFAGDRLAEVGLPTDTAMRIAVTMAADDQINPFGVAGACPIVKDPADNESKIGFGQHGGLGRHEQHPFLMTRGRRLRARREVRRNLAGRHRPDGAAPPAHGSRRHGWRSTPPC